MPVGIDKTALFADRRVMRRRRLLLVALSLAAAGAVLCVVLCVVLFLANRRADMPLDALKARWTDAHSRFVAIGGVEAHYRDEGQGPILLLLHGTSSSLQTWDGWVAALRGRWRVLRPDLPGFGLTGPDPSRDYGIAAYVRFVDAFLERVAGGAPCVVAGNSLGGDIAWQYALAHPSRVRGLILVDAAGYPLWGAGPPLAFRVARWPIVPALLAQLDPRRLVEDGVRRVYGDPSRVRPGVVDRYYELTLRPGNRVAFIDRMREARADDDSARIKQLRAPTLVLWGARDHLIAVEAARRFGDDIPGAQVIIYDDLGHVPMEEDPERTARDAARFLELLR